MGTLDTFLHFQQLQLYFKSKQAQKFSHDEVTLHTQYHAKTWKQRPSEKILQSVKKTTVSVECAPCPGHEHGGHLTGQKEVRLLAFHIVHVLFHVK